MRLLEEDYNPKPCVFMCAYHATCYRSRRLPFKCAAAILAVSRVLGGLLFEFSR